MNNRRSALALAGLACLIYVFLPGNYERGVAAQPGGMLVPVGAAYEESTLVFFAAQAAARDADGTVQIRVLPVTYASSPISIPPAERAQNLALAESRAEEVEAACELAAAVDQTCTAVVLDIQVRSDAEDSARVEQLDAGTDGIFILGGDQTIAMQVVANTLLEDRLETRYQEGVPLGGTSAGAAVQSRYMVAGYTGNNSAWDALRLGAVELWYGPLATSERGLRFGLQDAVIEQHVLERGRLVRMLQAVERLPDSHLGLGVDWGTAVRIEGGTIVTGTTGHYAAIVVDQETYQAAAGAVYTGTQEILSIHAVALHVLPPGGFGYDLSARQPVFQGLGLPAPSIGERTFGLDLPPAGYGTLFIAGDLATDPNGAVVQDFAALATDAGGTTIVFALGYGTDAAASQAASAWRNRLTALGVGSVQAVPLTSSADLDDIAAQLGQAAAVFAVGGNQAVLAGQVPALKAAGIDTAMAGLWQAGAPLLFDNAAAAAAGKWMSAEPTPQDYEIEASESFLAGHVSLAPGLDLLDGIVIEPRFLYDYLYGRLVSHLYAQPGLVGFGIERNTALRISPDAVQVAGEMAAMVFDGRSAVFPGTGSNGAFAAAWILIDVFASGQVVPASGGAPNPFEVIYLPLVLYEAQD